MLKRIKLAPMVLFFIIGFICLNLHAVDFEILELGDGKGKPGPIKLKSTYVNRDTGEKEDFYLETIKGEDIESLILIRTNPVVCQTFDDHSIPTAEKVRKLYTEKVLPQVGNKDSIFPFVLKDSQNAVKGFINLGRGYYGPQSKVFGVITDPGEKISENDYSEWHKGRGKAAIFAALDFMMLWHKDHPNHQEVNFKGEKVKLWGDIFDIFSATTDPGNHKMQKIMGAFGFKKISEEEVQKKPFIDYIKGKLFYEFSSFDDYQEALKNRQTLSKQNF